jgi:cell division protein FtsI/penicillin-binding protein 2
MLGGAVAGAGILGWRLYDWHVNQSADLAAQGAGTLLARTELYPRRGSIYDTTGDVLAIERSASRVVADPSVVHQESGAFQVANRLNEILTLDPISLANAVSNPRSRYALLARGVRDEQRAVVRQAVAAGELPGIWLEPDRLRMYPNGELGAHVLGFVGEQADRPGETMGQAGIEARYDDLLAGSPGLRSSDLDRQGRRIPIGRHDLLPARHGSHLTLTLDRTIQYIVEEELEIALERFSAESGSVVILNPQTGAILALANLPTYDPARVHEYQSFGPEFANRATSHIYEPGSTFKLITMAAGLETGAITPESTHNFPGEMRYFGEDFKNWDERTYPNQSMTSVLRHSSNTGAIFVADEIGADRFYTFVEKFGFGNMTGVDLSGEVDGIVRRRGDGGWFLPDLAANSFGHGIGVTPLQIASAIGAIANQGVLMRPHVVRAVAHADGESGFVQPQQVRRVISAETAQQLIQMMESAEAGIADNSARVPGYRTAGKTGTAEVPVGGRFSKDLSIASYVGFGPLENPQVLALVVVNHPQEGFFGSYVASPTFQRIMTRVFSYMKIPAREVN